MANLYHHVAFLLAAASLGACSLIDDGPGRVESPGPTPGTVMVTDDWSCIANESGAWDCTEPEPESEPESEPDS